MIVTDIPKMPNPGSAEAVARGCICAVLDNYHGAGANVRDDGSLEFWITQGCPIHAPEVPMEPLSERILAIAESEIINADLFEKWAQEVETLEKDLQALLGTRLVWRENMHQYQRERDDARDQLIRASARIEDLEDTKDGYKALYEMAKDDLAGRALMDAEGEAFLPEVVTQLQDRIKELEKLLREGLATCWKPGINYPWAARVGAALAEEETSGHSE